MVDKEGESSCVSLDADMRRSQRLAKRSSDKKHSDDEAETAVAADSAMIGESNAGGTPSLNETNTVTERVRGGGGGGKDGAESGGEAPAAASDEKKVLLVDKPNKWRNWTVRTISTIAMVVFFFGIVAGGPLPVTLTVVVLQVWAFYEVVAITYVWGKEREVPGFRLLMWYFLVVLMYFLYAQRIAEYLAYDFLADHHTFVTFVLYMTGFVVFVGRLKSGLYRYQILQFGWVHMALLGVVCSSTFIVVNIREGLVWFVLPASLIITNDIFAYIVGFFFGRTPLIELSPKKTWEGFAGGGVVTFVWAFLTSASVVYFDHLVCPMEGYLAGVQYGCQRNPVFQPHEYTLPEFLAPEFGPSITLRPFVLHSLAFALFASLIAPFGGFFASGIKRAFKIKDFGGFLPGHGGVVDRVDCQFMMGVFAYVYYTNFIKIPQLQLDTILHNVAALSEAERIALCAAVCPN